MLNQTCHFDTTFVFCCWINHTPLLSFFLLSLSLSFSLEAALFNTYILHLWPLSHTHTHTHTLSLSLSLWNWNSSSFSGFCVFGLLGSHDFGWRNAGFMKIVAVFPFTDRHVSSSFKISERKKEIILVLCMSLSLWLSGCGLDFTYWCFDGTVQAFSTTSLIHWQENSLSWTLV